VIDIDRFFLLKDDRVPTVLPDAARSISALEIIDCQPLADRKVGIVSSE
jgi:hypothetical protein